MGNLPVTGERFSLNKQQEECNPMNLIGKYQAMPLLNENDAKRAIQSMDMLMEQMLSEKLSKIEESKQSDDIALNSNTELTTSTNLVNMLKTRTEDYHSLIKQNGIVTAPAYKAAMESNNVCETLNNKANYKNLFPKLDTNHDAAVSELVATLGVESNSTHNPQVCSHMFPCNIQNETNLVPSDDSIKINLPEILDQNDEITILRLLIKLLSDKVRKLTDEKKRLLVYMSTLNDINNEMASIIEHNIIKKS